MLLFVILYNSGEWYGDKLYIVVLPVDNEVFTSIILWFELPLNSKDSSFKESIKGPSTITSIYFNSSIEFGRVNTCS